MGRAVSLVLTLTVGATVAAGCVATGGSDDTGAKEPPWIEERTDGRVLGVAEVEAHFADLSQWPEDWPPAEEFLAANFDASWPDEPTEIYVFQGGFQDAIYHVRFTLPGDELDAYQAAANCAEPIAPVKPIPAAEDGLDWWTPGEPEALIGCSLDDPGWLRHLQIDTIDPDAPVVYLSALSV